MFTNEQKIQKMDKFLQELKSEVEQSKAFQNGELISVIVTGSYAAYKLDPKLGNINLAGVPDINIYGIVNQDNYGHLRIALDYANVLRRVSQKSEDNIMLDLHPFYKSYGNIVEDKFNLQITSRIINAKNIDQYPITFWEGWQSCFYELCTNQKNYFRDLKFKEFVRDKKWLTDMYMALSSYNNAVHMAVASGMYENRQHIFTEVHRYIKEVLKDGISIGIPLTEKYDYKKIKAWKKDLIGFYVKYYGEECKEIILKIKDIDDNYFDYYSSCDVESLLKLFAELLDLVFNKGLCIRKQEILSDNDNLFNLLPLWY